MTVPRHFLQRPRRRLPPPPRPHHPARGEVVEAAVVTEAIPEVFVVVEPEPEAPSASDKPTWNEAMRKADLLAIAIDMGLPVSDALRKVDIVAALKAAKS